MAKYEFSNKEVEQLLTIISNANIKGSAAPAICDLINKLRKPLKEKKEE